MLRYSTGVGAYIRKFVKQNDLFIGYYILRKMMIAPVLKMTLALLTLNFGKLLYAYCNLVGVWRGFFAYGRSETLTLEH
jgi:hypothetical protein